MVLPWQAVKNIWKHRPLIKELIKRELAQRYQGSFLGVLWPIILPLVMLLIYTFVFSVVFKARWQVSGEQTPTDQFALILFAGLTAFNVFSEVANRSPSLVIGVPSYVKKVVFPLEILPVVTVGVALVNSLVNIALLVIGNLIILRSLSVTLLLLPLAYIPLILLCLGVSWFLASLGVYIRDIVQAIAVVVQIIFFLSPVFYSTSAVPGSFQIFFAVNPLVAIIEGFRQVLIWGGTLPWGLWGLWTGILAVFAWLGYVAFVKLKKGFADVL